MDKGVALLTTVLVALGDAAQAVAVLDSLDHLKLMATSQVILVHVVAAPDWEAPVDKPQGFLEAEQGQVEAWFRDCRQHLPCPCDLEVVHGDPAEEILRLARIHQASLIVLGSRGLTGVTRIMQGSVSAQVVADAPCPVLVVKWRSNQP